MKLINDFTQGKMDKEISGRLMPKGVYRDLLNGRVSSSDNSNVGNIENIIGTKKIDIPTIPVGFVVIGMEHFKDKLYYIATNGTLTTIGEYNKVHNSHEYLFKESDLFDLNKNILISKMIVFEDMLIFCDYNHSEPYKVNIKMARATFNWLTANPLKLSKSAQHVIVPFQTDFMPTLDYNDLNLKDIVINKVQGEIDKYMLSFNITENTLVYSIPRTITLNTIFGKETFTILQEVLSDYFEWDDEVSLSVDYRGYVDGGDTNKYEIYFNSSTLPTFTSTGVSDVLIEQATTPPGGLSKYVMKFTIPKNTTNKEKTYSVVLTAYDGSKKTFSIKQDAYTTTFRWGLSMNNFSISKDEQNVNIGCFTNQTLTVQSRSPEIMSTWISDVNLQFDPYGILGNKNVFIRVSKNETKIERVLTVTIKAMPSGDTYNITTIQAGELTFINPYEININI